MKQKEKIIQKPNFHSTFETQFNYYIHKEINQFRNFEALFLKLGIILQIGKNTLKIF